MPRIREITTYTNELSEELVNANTDVAGVRVGHFSLIEGEGELKPGHGPFSTGVTVILPHGGNLYQEKVQAAG